MEDDLSVISTCVYDHTCSSGCAKQACAHPGAFVSQSVTPKSCSHTLASDLHNLLTTAFYCICQSAFFFKKSDFECNLLSLHVFLHVWYIYTFFHRVNENLCALFCIPV